MNISEKFKHVRETEGLTQEKFADALGISRSSVSQIESNRAKPTIEIINNIISKFSIDANYFFKENIPNPIPNDIPNREKMVKNIAINKGMESLQQKNIMDRAGMFSDCLNIAMKINKIVEAILKILNLSRHSGKTIYLSENEVKVLNDLSDNYLDQLIELSLNKIKGEKDSEEFLDLSNELSIKHDIAYRLLNKIIDKAHKSALNLKNNEFIVLNPEDFQKQ